MELSGPEQRVGDGERAQALVDDPGKRGDARPQRSLWSVAASWTGVASGSVTIRTLVKSGSRSRGKSSRTDSGMSLQVAEHLPVIRLGGVEQEERVPGRGGVEHDEAGLAPLHDASEGTKDRDLLSARGPQILFEQGLALLVEVLARGRHDLGRVLGGFLGRVDAAHRQVRHARAERQVEMGRGVGGGKEHLMPAAGQATARLVATVVLPTPPLPMVRMTPCPCAGRVSGISDPSGGDERVRDSV